MKVRLVLSTVAFLLLVTHAANAQIASRETTEFVQKKGRHTARITFETRAFNARDHRIGRAGDCVTIDGRRPLGADCGLPNVEIASGGTVNTPGLLMMPATATVLTSTAFPTDQITNRRDCPLLELFSGKILLKTQISF